jgi:predicted RNase H-like nuclease (RuvC/YqgF family)
MSEDGNTETLTFSEIIEKHGFQEDLNKMMAENRRNLTKQNQELMDQLGKVKDQFKGTADEKQELEAKIEQLQEQYMTKEELAKREASKQQKQFQQELENAAKERDTWKGMYTSETIDRTLQDAAIQGEAMHPDQIVAMLKNATYLKEILEEGQVTGKYASVIKFNDIDEDGKPVVLELTPSDAIKRMKELPEKYGNLFKGTATGGLGESSGTGKAGTGQVTLEQLKDPVKYAKWRKENPDLDLSNVRR